MLCELLLRAGVAERPSEKVCRALPDGQIQALDERRVQCRRVLGVVERFFESPRGSMNGSSFDLHDAVVPSRLEDLRVERCWPKDATNDLLVEIESVGHDQGKTLEIHPVGNVANKRQSVPVTSSSYYGRRPESRPHFDRDEDPGCLCPSAGEGANLIGLELLDTESGDPCAVETTASLGRFLNPASNRVPGETLDPSDRRNADTFDSEGDDGIERSSPMLKTVVGRAFGRRERLSTPDAPVSTPFPRPGSVESVAEDVCGTDSSTGRMRD